MKRRTALICLAAFSILICGAQAVEHLMWARGTKAVLSIMRSTDPGMERAQDTLRAHYRAVEASIAVIVAQGLVVFLLIRRDYARPVA
jgi:hypothetical protein